MSSAAGARSKGANAGLKSPEGKNKGKEKSALASPDVSMEEDDDDDSEEEYDDSENDDEDNDEDLMDDVDPTEIVGRRTRGIKVDYTSKEALEKAGLKPRVEKDEDEDEDEDEETEH